MYEVFQIVHSYWAYLVLLVLTLATFNAIIKTLNKSGYAAKDFRISLFTLIVSHLQLLIGLVLYFLQPYFVAFSEQGMGAVMKDSTLRLYLVEHPLTMIIAIVLITIGYSKHKKKLSSTKKFRTIAIFYALALILVLSRIPWDAWL
jgi:heme A synthase